MELKSCDNTCDTTALHKSNFVGRLISNPTQNILPHNKSSEMFSLCLTSQHKIEYFNIFYAHNQMNVSKCWKDFQSSSTSIVESCRQIYSHYYWTCFTSVRIYLLAIVMASNHTGVGFDQRRVVFHLWMDSKASVNCNHCNSFYVIFKFNRHKTQLE